MTNIMKVGFLGLCSFLLLGDGYAASEPKYAIAMHGEPQLPEDFKHFPYADPQAPQGGIIRQTIVGSFDSVNPFIIKGTGAWGVRTYVFESLMGRNLAEPFSLYGLLAETIDVSEDRNTFTFKIRSEAQFSDGSPVTSADVVFSLETLREKGRPNYKNNYRDVERIETPDERTVTVTQKVGNRELPLLIGLMPILSRKSWEGKKFEETTLDPIIGSGPYVMADIKPGEAIVYKKNPGYWGKKLPVGKGFWNFETVRFDYYKDANASFEAFKKGDADVRIENDPVRWSTGYTFPAVQEGKITLEKIPQKTPAPASGFAFNTRRKIFEDVKVREALTMAFDFEWANANLFSGSFKRTYGYYSGSDLSSENRPAEAAELALLGEAASQVAINGSYKIPVSDGSGRDRKMLRAVVQKLTEAGWTIGDNGMTNTTGEPLSFTISIQNKDQEKIALHYQRTLEAIGIKALVRIVDSAQFTAIQKSYDYDMIPVTWFNSLSPGNEHEAYYGSAGRSTEGTRNYPGIADPAVDAAIKALLTAKSREDLIAAARVIDRLLIAGHYIIPFYDAGGQWVARWNYIGRPEQQPLPGFEATTLWRVP
jgi:peptide/nickel transport system substrate-binding protein